MATRKEKIAEIFKKAERYGSYISQAHDKSGEHGLSDPKTDEELLGWLIDEWVIQSTNAPTSTGEEQQFRIDKAAKLARFVNDLMDLGLKPRWPWK